MTAAHIALVLSLIPLVAQQSPPPASADATTWPIPGVELPGKSGVTAPRVIRDVKPNYTAAAMRARIQGVVALECVVEPDGSVGPVRIVRSLDAVHGLDDEALRVVKQWRFLPGTKDGAPVRVAVTIEMSFTIRGRGDSSAANPRAPMLGWPDAFADASEVPVSLPAGWSEDVVQTSTVEVRFAYPPGWSILRATDEEPHAPSGIAEHLRTAHDGMRMWAFVTTASGRSLQVFCSVLHAANTTDADKDEDIHRAGLEFGAVLRRMSIQER